MTNPTHRHITRCGHWRPAMVIDGAVRLGACEDCDDDAYYASIADAQDSTHAFLLRNRDTSHLAEIFAADGWDNDGTRAVANWLHDLTAPSLEDAVGMLEEFARIVRLHIEERSRITTAVP